MQYSTNGDEMKSHSLSSWVPVVRAVVLVEVEAAAALSVSYG